MWWKGLNSVKTGSKWAKNTCLSIPNGPGSLVKKPVFDPFLTHFWSPNGPFSRHFGIFHEPKRVTTSSKWAKNTCLSIQNGSGSLLEKRDFDPFWTHFWSQNGPFSRHFGIFHWPKRVTTGSKRAETTCLSIINGPGSLLEKHVFDPFWTHCWSQNGPFSRHCGIFHGPKCATTGSKRAKNTCLSIPSGLGTTLEKMFFPASGTLVDPPLAPTVRRLACPPAPPSDHWYGGLRVSLGDFEAWKPPKVGGCGWTRCPRNRILSHVAQDMACAWFRGVGAHGADFGAFWRFFRPFLGHIVELKGTRGLSDTVKSSRMCSVATVSLRLGVLPGFEGYFGRKMAVFGPKLRRFGRAPPYLAPPPRGATGEFLAQNLDSARPPPRLQDGYMGKKSEALGRSNGQNGMETCCCLLLLLVVC